MKCSRKQVRRGTILVLAVFLMMTMMAIVAMSVDLGYVYSTRAEMQRTADASALAGAWALLDSQSSDLDSSALTTLVRNESQEFAYANHVGTVSPCLQAEDVTIGHLGNPADPSQDLSNAGGNPWNAVRVRVRRTAASNGEVPLFFARTMGWASLPQSMEATAAFWPGVKGFRIPPHGENLGILPFALDIDTWNDLMAGNAPDDWSYDPDTGQITAGPDGELEVNLFPQGTGSPGNRGTVDIGSSNNSTNDIKRQITDGVSEADLAHLGGELKLNEDGEVSLNGDTGISAAVKEQLNEIRGEPRVIPIFESVSGNGNNANYRIVKFCGVRIMEVKLTGSMNTKRVIIQPANICIPGAIPSTDSTVSDYVYTPVKLVR